ncbi:MAG: hypothetical protein IJ808_01065, partial [Muribaculaceae bacterium]|nr:hypothetical protein [Muribaculaceae bacterium]
MKKIYRLFVATGLLFTIGVSAAASSFHDYAASKPMAAIHQVKEARPVQADIDPATTTSLKQETPPSAGGQLSRAPRRAVSAADLPTNPLQIDYASGDSYITASAVTFTLEGNTISISNFAGYGKTITGTVNLETGVVAFPRQQVQDNATYGNCDLVSVNDGLASIDTLASVTGTLADGILTLGHWTMLITQGDYAGYILGTVRDKSVFRAANATMNVVQLNYDDEGNLTGSTPATYPVIATQTATNEVEVLNFLGMGYRHLIGIKSDKTLAIAPQQLFRNNDYGVFFFYPFDEATGVTTIGGTLRGTTEGNKLAWGGSAIHTSNGKYFYARYRSCEIQLSFDLQYPAAQTQAGFKGSGTEDDPWLIETMADLLALSDSVNYGTTTDPTGKYVKMFEGKFFKQTKVINAKGYNFPPIGGNDDLYRFAGTYDGDNKAISNLTINTVTNGYAGLFGSVDTCGVLKNISITSPVIECSYYFAGAVAGNCNGTMINCKATTPKVTGQYTVGGLAGKVGPATQCSVTTGTIVAEAQCGGVFGVSRYPLSFINATNTNVMITGTTSQSPVGGLLGQMSGDFGGSISDSYFSGNVYLTRTTQFAGGIVGTTSRNTIDRCFSLAQIGMLGNTVGTAVAGGIVGGAIATDFTDCYFAGENRLSTSRSGAIVGYTLNVIYTGFPDHINLTRCYVTGMVNCTLKADYNPYVGQFDTQGAGLPPVLTDCYYDEQMLPLITSKNGALKTSEMTGTAPKLEGFSADTWTFTANLYPRLTSVATNQAAYVSAA